MNIFSIFGKKRSLEESDYTVADFLRDAYDMGRQPAGQVVNPTTAARVSALFACHTAIAESIAMLPAMLVEATDERTNVMKREHSLWKVLHDQPNPFMDSFEFFEAMQWNALDHGDAYAHVTRSRAGEVIQLLPLDPSRVEVKFDGKELKYFYREPETTLLREYKPAEILHFKHHTKDGIKGRTPIKVASDAVAFALALQEYGNKIFENGAFMSGFIQAPHAFKDDNAREAFMNSFKKYFGSKKAGKAALLEQGVTFKEASMKNTDAQWAESMQFAAIEMARLYRMPPVMIQCMEKGMAFASVEQLNLMFTQHTIQPWVTRWERCIKRQLLNSKADENVYPKFNVNALLRGDLVGRTSAIINQLQYGLLTINEARNLEDRNPIEEEIGDKPLLSHNLRPADEPAPNTPQNVPASTEKLDKKDDEKPADKERSIDEAAFLPMFRWLLGRYVNKAQKREAKPEVLEKLVTEALVPAAQSFLGAKGKRDTEQAANVAVRMFLEKWLEQITTNTTASETVDQETERRAREFLSILTDTAGLNVSSAPVVHVHTGPNVVEFKSAPKQPETFRLKYELVNGQREAIIKRE